MNDEPLLAKVLTVSDGVFHGFRDDTGGRGLAAHLIANGYEVVEHRVTEDGAEAVADSLREMSDGFAGLIVTTGGTGFAPRDQTPEGTRAVIDREAPGLAEAMRLVSPHGRLSRGVAGTTGYGADLQHPGQPKGNDRTDRRGVGRSAARAEAAGQRTNRPLKRHRTGVSLASVLRIVLPKGSLEKATLELFEAADLNVIRSSTVDYRATIDDPRVAEVRILRPQEIPVYVAEGLFDLGITGRDWVEETASAVVSLGELRVLEGDLQPDQDRGRRRRRLGGQARRRPPRRRACHVGVPRADASILRRARRATPTSASRTAPARPRSPTSPTAWSTSPRPVGPCAPPGCG